MLEYQEIILTPLSPRDRGEELPALLQVLRGRVRRWVRASCSSWQARRRTAPGCCSRGGCSPAEKYGGSQTLQAQLSPGELFGESPALLPDGAGPLPVMVQAAASA